MASSINASNTGFGGVLMSGDSSGQLQLQTAGTTAVTVDTSQNVGIGTTSPSAPTTVKGRSADGLGIRLLPPATTTAYNSIQWTDDPVTQEYSAILGDTSKNLIFRTNSANERMRIDSSGNVLVGSTSTTGRISSTNDNTFNATGTPSNLQKSSFVSYGTFGGGFTVMDGTQGYVLYAQTSGADFYIRRGTTSSALTGGVALINAATSWSSASDENVKDIIEPIENAIEKVSTLRTVIGKYKDEEEGIRHPFLIAQDVEKVLPEAISIMNKDSEHECLGLSYTDTIPLLVAAIKEQQAIIEDLKQRIETLEAK